LHKPRKCVRCGAASPEEASSHTLISAKHGWRVTRRQLADGGYVLDWHCQHCWQQRKAKDATIPTEPDTEAGRTFKSVVASLRRSSSKPTG
jgi:hypothetical protein